MSNEFEKAIQSRFQDFEAQVGDHLFDAIQAGRQKRRVAVWWWRGLSGAAVLILAAFFLFSGSENAGTEPTAAVMQDGQRDISELPAREQSGQQLDHVQQASGASGTEQLGPQSVQSADPTVVTLETNQQEPQLTRQNPVEEPAAPEQVLPEYVERSEPYVLDETAIPVEETIQEEEAVAAEQAPQEQKRAPAQRRPAKLGLDVFVGPGYASRVYTGGEADMQWRRSAEAPSMSFNAGMSLTYKLNPRVRLASGLHFAQRNEILNFSYYVNGGHVEVSGRNHYTRLSVPLTAEYDLYVQNLWKFRALAGLSYALDQRQKGKARIGESQSLILQDQEIERIGSTAAVVGVGLDLRLNKRAELMIQPLFMHDINATKTGTIGLERREFAVFTDIGLRFAL